MHDVACLALDTKIHDVVSTDGTVVDHQIPRPQGYCIPLKQNEAQTTTLLGHSVGHHLVKDTQKNCTKEKLQRSKKH